MLRPPVLSFNRTPFPWEQAGHFAVRGRPRWHLRLAVSSAGRLGVHPGCGCWGPVRGREGSRRGGARRGTGPSTPGSPGHRGGGRRLSSILGAGPWDNRPLALCARGTWWLLPLLLQAGDVGRGVLCSCSQWLHCLSAHGFSVVGVMCTSCAPQLPDLLHATRRHTRRPAPLLFACSQLQCAPVLLPFSSRCCVFSLRCTRRFPPPTPPPHPPHPAHTNPAVGRPQDACRSAEEPRGRRCRAGLRATPE
jgi:hypothetical protein